MSGLPNHFAHWLQLRLASSPNSLEAERQFLLKHLDRWRTHPLRVFPLPGYLSPPANAPGKTYPSGWSYSNFQHHARAARRRLALTL